MNPYEVTSNVRIVQGAESLHQEFIFRKGDLLVVYKWASLPNYCVKTNVPTTSKLTFKLAWFPYSLWLYLLAIACALMAPPGMQTISIASIQFPTWLIGCLVFMIVTVLASKKATIQVPLEHGLMQKRMLMMFAVRGLFLVCIGGYVLSEVFLYQQLSLVFSGTFLVVLASQLFASLVGWYVVSIDKIENDFVFLKGTTAEFRNWFCEWPNP
jgi:hypothetical protein